jgi:electron transport complex protein RnfD
MVGLGGFICIAIGKLAFGGLGYNCFNPALVGRAILQAAFPVAMTTWTVARPEGRFQTLLPSTLAAPLSRPELLPDAVSGATPLSQWKFDGQSSGIHDLAFGFTGGSAGETCALLIVIGGLWLILRHMMNWRIPIAIVASVAAFSGALYAVDPARYPSPAFMMFSGGLMLGAVFMASDMVGSPMTHLGCVVYGVLIGTLVVVIRIWGGMPEGVMYAILLGNAATPHIDRWLQPRVFGTRSGRKP